MVNQIAYYLSWQDLRWSMTKLLLLCQDIYLILLTIATSTPLSKVPSQPFHTKRELKSKDFYFQVLEVVDIVWFLSKNELLHTF